MSHEPDAPGSPVASAAKQSGRLDALVEAFRREFGAAPTGFAEAPGRVNLIGEHVDYNDGLVLPFAIDRSVVVAWSRRDDDAVWAYSADYDQHSRFNLANITRAAPGEWSNYARGVLAILHDAQFPIAGINLAIAGDVPRGAGLSSSAAIEVAIAGAVRDAFDLPITGVELARLCQRAENEFVGVNSGIMDQFASALSETDHALLIDCRALEYRAVPLRLAAGGLSIVVANSGVQRELVASAYNVRRAECDAAVTLLRTRLSRPDLRSLRDVSAAEIASLEIAADDAGIALHRARHVVTEIQRVREAADALDRDDFARVGALMRASHESLRTDYAVSSPQLDLLVALASQQDYVRGARLTGAGFGGCTVNLVQTDALPAFGRDVIAPYRNQTGLPAEMYITAAGAGLRTRRL